MFPWLDANLILLIVLLILGLFTQNHPIIYAIVILLLIRYTPLKPLLPLVEKNGLQIGITILTVAVLVPIVTGKIDTSKAFTSFFDWKLIAAIAVGALVSWLGGRGVSLMTYQPQLITGLLLGTALGVALFKGVAVGPLIAAGILSALLFLDTNK
ncbi:DUF441 domain-containing protein [Thorsellia kenyensis]|uniref:UPF0756 membrane protein ACFFIT_01795 n=1 Tax=Thorsellia kenyensis TaxID=1549888 RepID=A0ABV6C796_9GAMM